MKSVLFARVSSREQEDTGYSLPSQEKFLKEYAERREFKVAKKFSISESASGKYQRETFKEMMEYVKKNNIKIIICEKVDRLTRNFKDAVLIDEWLEEDEERQVHLVKDSLVLHKNSRSQEKLNWGVRILFAKNYIDNLSEEVKKGQKEKIAQGWLPTKPPLGYKTTGDKGHKIHIMDETVAPLVRRMFELYSSGNYSINALVKKMYAEGLRTRGGNRAVKSRMHDLLSDPFYCGKIRWKGEVYPGKQEPLISKELFDVVQEKLTRKIGSPQYKKHLPVFKGKIFCAECEGTVTWEIQKGHWYGHCNHYRQCSQKKYTRQEEIEEQLFSYLEDVAPKYERVLQWLDKALKENHSDQIQCTEAKRGELNRGFERIQKRLEAIYEDKIDEKIPPDFYEKKFKEYTTEKEQILEALGKLNKSNTKYYEAGYAIHELARKARAIYLSPEATSEDKRLLLSYAFSLMGLKDDVINPEYSLAFEFLVEWMPRVNKIFEPTKNLAKSEVLCGVSVNNTGLTSCRVTGTSKDFRTSRNPYPKPRFAFSTTESRLLLAWRQSLRTTDWGEIFPYPTVSLQQIKQLLAIVSP